MAFLFSADIDILEEALEQAARAHQKAFDFERFDEYRSECIEDFECDWLIKDEHLNRDAFTGHQISAQLSNLVQDLKHCTVATSSEEDHLDNVSNADIVQDLQLAMQEDMTNLPEFLAAQDEEKSLEQALGEAAQQYEESFASDRLACNKLASFESDPVNDCADFQFAQDMEITWTEDLEDDLIFESPESELELSMLRDMNSIPFDAETVERTLIPHPRQVVTTRTKSKSAVSCSLPVACFSNARAPCSGMHCGSPKRVVASPASAAWRSQRV